MSQSLHPGPHADRRVPVSLNAVRVAMSGQALSGVFYGLLVIDSGRVT